VKRIHGDFCKLLAFLLAQECTEKGLGLYTMVFTDKDELGVPVGKYWHVSFEQKSFAEMLEDTMETDKSSDA